MQKLVSCGVSRTNAEQLCRDCVSEDIKKQIDVFQWIMEHETETLKNPAGYLAELILQGYQPPGKYRTPEQRAESEKIKHQRRDREEKQKREEAAKQQQIRRE